MVVTQGTGARSLVANNLSESLVVSFAHADPAQIAKLGAKGAKLVEDFQHFREDFPDLEDAITVPDGFILSTDVWQSTHQNSDRLTEDLLTRVFYQLHELERREGRRFGDNSGRMPLIVAVRGGAPVSLPGAIATVLNVGLNEGIVEALLAAGEDERFVLATYANAIRMYGEVVLGLPYEHFYDVIHRLKLGEEGSYPLAKLRDLVTGYRKLLEGVRHPYLPPGFEPDVSKQLRNVVEAVLASWMAPLALEARHSREPKVLDDMGTAVIIQSMVFGNRDEKNSLSGVFFSRNQRTGANEPVIEWAPRIQCDKIVSGKIRKRLRQTRDLQEQYPDIYSRLLLVKDRLEARARRPLDIEFTVENRKLYILQRRPLRMTFNATVRAMWDLVDEGKTNVQLASLVINNALEQPEKVLRDGFTDYRVLARGEPITDSADCGILAIGTEDAIALAGQGKEVILLRKSPYGETDLAVNHPRIRGIVRCDGSTTGHEAVSAVAYSKPYLINMVGADGEPLIITRGEDLLLDPDSKVARFVGRRVFVDGERGILGHTEAHDFLEDRKVRKKLYVDWEYVRKQFDEVGYEGLGYWELLDLHYQWELDLEHFQGLEKRLKGGDTSVPQEQLRKVFFTYLTYVPRRDWERTLRLKEVRVEDFTFAGEISNHGHDLGREVLKILKALMLCTTWCTHWVHEIMVQQARARGETENDVIRDISLKNRTMSLVRDFEQEGFHLMKTLHYSYLIFASNFEYGQDLNKVDIGPGALNFSEKEVLARNFLAHLAEINADLFQRVRIIQGEPPLGQGHARIISIGICIPNEDFDLVCRYLRAFLGQVRQGEVADLQDMIPAGEFIELYRLEPFFAPYPELKITRGNPGADTAGDCLLVFGHCSFGEFDGAVYGKESYEVLMQQVRQFEDYLETSENQLDVRPWQFEVDPYRRHSVIAAVGLRFPGEKLQEVLDELKNYLVSIRKAPFLDSRLRGNDEPEPIRRGEVHTGK